VSPFDFVKEIQVGKHDLLTDPQSEKDYVAFIINKTLSYEMDCLLYANEMNRRHHLDRKLQYHYLLHTIRSRRRGFHKWSKPIENEALEAVKEVWECSDRKAIEILRILSAAQIEAVMQVIHKGGRIGKSK
jgi:hypothetical protein